LDMPGVKRHQFLQVFNNDITGVSVPTGISGHGFVERGNGFPGRYEFFSNKAEFRGKIFLFKSFEQDIFFFAVVCPVCIDSEEINRRVDKNESGSFLASISFSSDARTTSIFSMVRCSIINGPIGFMKFSILLILVPLECSPVGVSFSFRRWEPFFKQVNSTCNCRKALTSVTRTYRHHQVDVTNF